EGGTRSSTCFFGNYGEDCWSIFHRAAKAIPPGRDNPARIFSRHVAQIENHQPKPPACSNRSAALKACSRLPAQRTHSKRSKSIPGAAAGAGANTSLVSIRAQVSS